MMRQELSMCSEMAEGKLKPINIYGAIPIYRYTDIPIYQYKDIAMHKLWVRKKNIV